MSEITKLYENCNIKPKQEGYCDWDSNCPYPRLKCNDECPYWKDENEAKYPPFTPEKQIELIKWLARQNFVVCKNLGGWHTGINPTYDEDFGITCSKRATNLGSFEYALAGLINNLWQDLTEEEKQQVKEILK